MSDTREEHPHNNGEEQFLSVVAHELRTPLSITKWYTEMLLDGDCGELNEEQKKYLNVIQASNIRAIDLIRSILNVSRLSLGTFSVTPVEIDLRFIVKDALQEVSPSSARKGICIREHYEGAVPGMLASVQADKKICLVLIRTLLLNAIAFSKENSEVELSIKEFPQGSQVAGKAFPEDSFLISVKDNGIGIPESDKEKIFSEFFKGSNSGEVEGAGAGLGLYMVSCIIAKVGGDVWFESKQDVGSTFYVRMPKHGMQRKEGRVTLD